MKKFSRINTKVVLSAILTATMLMTSACSVSVNGIAEAVPAGQEAAAEETAATAEAASEAQEVFENSEDGGHAITADGETAEYSGIKVSKTGESQGDEADFYGENSAIFATNGATLTIDNADIETAGTHANAVFSYGEGTTVNISDSNIETSGNCSGGLMTTGGGTMNAENLTIHTTGNSSAAIRSDRGGGTVNVSGGTYTTDGKGSPAIYSTADITVSDAELTSTTSQGVVVEGKNSVALENVTLNADNNAKNSDKSDYFQAVMIYQSMSGDADEGTAGFSMEGGSLTNANGDIFFVNNTRAVIDLKGAQITNNGDGVFLRAAAAGWGNEGSNGGHVDLNADGQVIDGDMLVDEISTLNLYLKNGSDFNGAISGADASGDAGKAGEVYVELDEGSKWTLTGDSYITSLTCGESSIDLNGHKLYVNGEEYKEGTASTGEAIKVEIQNTGRGNMPEPPGGGKGGPGGVSGNGIPGGKGGPGSISGNGAPGGKGGFGGRQGGPQGGVSGNGIPGDKGGPGSISGNGVPGGKGGFGDRQGGPQSGGRGGQGRPGQSNQFNK